MSDKKWRWVSEDAVLAIYEQQHTHQDGAAGIRDHSLLLSALAAPQRLAANGNPDVAELAASYAAGIARNRVFLNGNMRTALIVAAGVFLPLNGYQLTASDEETATVMRSVAAGSMTDEELAAWFLRNIRPLPAE